MAKQDAAADLAVKLVQTLQQQRDLGGNTYPLTISQLGALAAPEASPELIIKALGKKPFAAQVVAANKKDSHSPIALAEDSTRLLASPLLLEFALGLLCSPEKPVFAVDKVVGKVDKSLRPDFKTTLEKQLAENSLPSTVGSTTIKNKPHLYLKKYPPPLTPAAALATRLIETLRARRAEGGTAYPVTLAELKQLTDPTAKPALFKQALAQETFQKQVIQPVPSHTDAPIALAEDRDFLAGSAALLEYLLVGSTTARKPLALLGHLTFHLITDLQTPFQDAVLQQIEQHQLPATVGVLWRGDTPELYLVAEVSASWLLAQKLLLAVKSQQSQGGSAYPTSLPKVLQIAAPDALPEQVRKALADKELKKELVLALPGNPNSLVLLADDRDTFATSPTLLEHALDNCRSADTQAFPLRELKKKLDKTLQYTFEVAVEQQLANKTLPASVGSVRIKKMPYLFLVQDLTSVPDQPTIQAKPVESVSVPVTLDFVPLFEKAFAELDRQRGGYNQVSLVDLRQKIPIERSTFDSELQQLRRAGRYSLSAAEGRQGISPEERAAGIVEDGSLLLFVSRRQE